MLRRDFVKRICTAAVLVAVAPGRALAQAAKCVWCNGSGHCCQCGGSGGWPTKCWKCAGTGQCTSCHGTGHV